MRNRTAAMMLAFVLVPFGGSVAGRQTAQPSTAQPAVLPAPAGDEAAHEALRGLRALYERAIAEGQPARLAPHIASDFHGVMVTGRVVKSLADLQAYWQEIRTLIGEGGTYRTTVTPELSILLGDVALARGTTDDVVVTSDGTEFRFTSYWTAALARENGVWKIRQVQGSMDPIANPFVREFSRRALWMTGGAAGVVGLLVGAAVMMLVRRRRRT